MPKVEGLSRSAIVGLVIVVIALVGVISMSPSAPPTTYNS